MCQGTPLKILLNRAKRKFVVIFLIAAHFLGPVIPHVFAVPHCTSMQCSCCCALKTAESIKPVNLNNVLSTLLMPAQLSSLKQKAHQGIKAADCADHEHLKIRCVSDEYLGRKEYITPSNTNHYEKIALQTTIDSLLNSWIKIETRKTISLKLEANHIFLSSTRLLC